MLALQQPSASHLEHVLKRRLGSEEAQRLLDDAEEIVVFGSMSAGLARRDSDLDVLVVSHHGKFSKSDRLDLVGISLGERHSSQWTSSELASHIGAYGVWLKGAPNEGEFSLGQLAIDAKERRIRSFLRSLPKSWQKLDELFKLKYATKLRRETQRLILLERKIPIPPTRLLDEEWEHSFGSMDVVFDRMRALQSDVDSYVFTDLYGRIAEQFELHA